MSIFNKKILNLLYRRIVKLSSDNINNETTSVEKTMFKQSYNKGGFKDAETVIGPSVMIKGNFNSQGNIIIEGILKGDVKTSANIFIGDKAKVTANIDAKTARAGGEIKGNIIIKDHLEIVASAKVHGDIECGSISVENGAIINGKIIMNNEDKVNGKARESGLGQKTKETSTIKKDEIKEQK